MNTNSYISKNAIPYPLLFLIDANAGPQFLVHASKERITIYHLSDTLSEYCHNLTNSNEFQHWEELKDCFYHDNRKVAIFTITYFEGLWTGYDASDYKENEH
jgi:hypothetical protein